MASATNAAGVVASLAVSYRVLDDTFIYPPCLACLYLSCPCLSVTLLLFCHYSLQKETKHLSFLCPSCLALANLRHVVHIHERLSTVARGHRVLNHLKVGVT